MTLPETVAVYHVAGESDFLVHVAVRDAEHLRNLTLDGFTTRTEVARLNTALIYEHAMNYHCRTIRLRNRSCQIILTSNKGWRMARGIKSWIWLGLKGLFVLILIGPGLVWAVLQDPEFGGEIAGHRVEASAQYAHTHFKNPTDMVDYDLWVNLQDFMGSQNRVPPGPFPTQSMRLSENAAQGLEAYWLGHATVFVELEGVRILTDPMLTSHAFPVKWLSPKRHNPPPISLSQLPPIDIAVISHDHYDHLDMKTVTQLARGLIFVGLGVGAHLEA